MGQIIENLQRSGVVLALRNALREYYPAALEAFDDLPTATPWRCSIARPPPSRPPT